MAMRIGTHRVGCLCPVCKAGRGETRRTKAQINVSLNIGLLANFREYTRLHEISLTQAMEEAMKLYLEKQQQAHFLDSMPPVKGRVPPGQAERVKQLNAEEPLRTDIREYTDEELKEWDAADRLNPDVKMRLDATLRKVRRSK